MLYIMLGVIDPNQRSLQCFVGTDHGYLHTYICIELGNKMTLSEVSRNVDMAVSPIKGKRSTRFNSHSVLFRIFLIHLCGVLNFFGLHLKTLREFNFLTSRFYAARQVWLYAHHIPFSEFLTHNVSCSAFLAETKFTFRL